MRGKKRYRELHNMAMAHYGGDHPQCTCCRIEANEFLHVADTSGRSRQDVIMHPENYPEDMILLCWNCSHCMVMYDECIHQRPVSEY